MRIKNADQNKLVELLSSPRTAAEISAAFPALSSPEKVRAATLPDGWKLFEQKNARNEPVFLILRSEEKAGVKPRIWSYWREDFRKAPGETPQPYLWIQMPHDLPTGELRIVPLSDVHYGARAHSRDRFQRYVDWIAKTDNVFAFLNGDIIENALGDSIGGAVYESIMTPEEQLWGSKVLQGEPGIIEILRPIAHKTLWAQPGNHEWRTWKKANIDPLKVICRELGIPYFAEPIFADVLAWGHRFTFYCHHGVSGSQTKGGKMNAARRPAGFQDPIHFIIMGHVHDSMANVETVIERHREYDEHGRVIAHRLVERPRYTIICPSFYGFFDSYGARAGYSPGSWGSVACILYKDGNYRWSE